MTRITMDRVRKQPHNAVGSAGFRESAYLICAASKPTFWAYWVLPLLVFAIPFRDQLGALAIIHATLYIVLIHSATNMHNEITDRREDAVNHPGRISIAERLGAVLTVATLLCYVLAILLVCLAIPIVPPPVVVLGAAGVVLAYQYNSGARIKKRTGWSHILMAFAQALLIIGVWLWAREPITALPAAAWLIPLFVLCHTWIKDIADVRGDAAVGYRSIYSIKSRSTRLIVVGTMISVPYIIISVGALGGWFADTYLLCLLCWPISVFAALASPMTGSPARLYRVYEAGHVNVHIFTTIAAFAATGRPIVFAIGGGLIVFRLLANELRLHPRLLDARLGLFRVGVRR